MIPSNHNNLYIAKSFIYYTIKMSKSKSFDANISVTAVNAS